MGRLGMCIGSAACLVLTASASGCAGDDDAAADSDARPVTCKSFDAGAGFEEECWPEEVPAAGGITVELGTGEIEFQPMPEELHILCGGQLPGFFFAVNARGDGMEPGDPRSVLCPSNPKTRFRAVFADTGEPIGEEGCATRQVYMDYDGDGVLALRTGQPLAFASNLEPEDIFGKKYRITVEILDVHGNYATDEKIVTALPPVDWDDGNICAL